MKLFNDPPAALRRIALAAVAALAVVVPVTASEAASIAVALGIEPNTLDPQARDDGAERAINDNIYETLLVRTPDGVLQPGLAAALPTQIDDVTWEVTLREGIRFHDGEALDAEAVAFSLNRIIDPELNSEQLHYANAIKEATAVDPTTVRIVTQQPDPILPARLYWIKIVPPGAAASPDFASHPVGTGPFKFARWTRGEEVVLEANADYWGGAPAIDEVSFRFIPDASTRLAGLLAGELDLITNAAPEFIDQLPKVAKIEGIEVPFVVINARPGAVTSDVRVRQALLYAINRDELAEGLFEGNATPATGQLVTPADFGFDESISAYPYDPDKARALIREAGAEGATIRVLGPGGRFLKDRDVVEALAAYFSAVGLNAIPDVPEWSEYVNRLFDVETRPDIYYSSAGNELFDADRSVSAFYAPSSARSSNADPDLEAWTIAARLETDVEKRRALYSQIFQRGHDQALVSSLLRVQDIYGLSERLNWTPRVDGKIILREATVTE